MKTLILLMVALTATARADEVICSNYVSILGHVVRMDQTEVTIKADYKVGTKEWKIPRGEVIRIDFNDSTFNPGGAPPPGALPPLRKSKIKPSEVVSSAYAVIDNGKHEACALATIDVRHTLHCGNEEFSGERVTSVFLVKK